MAKFHLPASKVKCGFHSTTV